MNRPDPETPDALTSQPTSGSPAHEEIATITSQELLQNRREITIRHGEELYRLRLTKSGKLILHK